MSDVDDHDERIKAAHAALEVLFAQYPPCEPLDRSAMWRRDALRLLHEVHRERAVGVAVYHARGTGVPNDVLTALEVLLNE